MSISPTFYEQLFRTKDFRTAFLCLHCRFELFRRKEIGAKAARKMLVKLTADSSSPEADHLAGTAVSVSGWGKTNELSLSASETLKTAHISIYNQR